MPRCDTEGQRNLQERKVEAGYEEYKLWHDKSFIIGVYHHSGPGTLSFSTTILPHIWSSGVVLIETWILHEYWYYTEVNQALEVPENMLILPNIRGMY